MAGAVGTGANIYPVTQGLEGSGTGKLGNITTTGDKDAAVAMFNDHTVWGNAFFPYTLDVNGAGSAATPYLVKSGDGGDEDWELTDVYGRRLFGHVQLVTSGVSCTIGVDCDGALSRLAMGGTIFCTVSGTTITLPEIVANTPNRIQVDLGASLCVLSGETNNLRVEVDPNGNDAIIHAGTKDSAGDSVINAATNDGGDYICFMAVYTDAWLVMGYKGTWTAN